MAWYAGLDVGATNLRAVVATEHSEIAGTYRRPTPQDSGIAVTEAVLDSLRRACDESGIEPTELAAVGVGSIGPLDTVEGVAQDPANLPDAVEQIPLTGPLEKLVEAPVYLHNDANAGVIGERFYAEHNPNNMVYLTISSGIGAGVIVDGTVLSGWDGNAGEVGHIPLDSNGALQCGCGKYGHWEAYCSGNNIPRYARYLYEDDSVHETDSCHEISSTSLPLDSETFEATDVFAAVGEDAFADQVLERVMEWNARGVTALVHAYAPMVIYVGGAVALHNPVVVEELRKRVPELVMTNVPDIRPSTLGDDIVVKGALASAITRGTGARAD